MSKKLIIDPVTRIEGHGKVTVHLDDYDNVVDARLHVVEFRGFEKFVQGHPFWEAPMLMQRICGICFVSHHLCGAKALDDMIGAGANMDVGITRTAEKIFRRYFDGDAWVDREAPVSSIDRVVTAAVGAATCQTARGESNFHSAGCESISTTSPFVT